MKRQMLLVFTTLLVFCVILTGCQTVPENPIASNTPEVTSPTPTPDASQTATPESSVQPDTQEPTAEPTETPSDVPAETPTEQPTEQPTQGTEVPTQAPTQTQNPTATKSPTKAPTATKTPTKAPTKSPTKTPAPTATPKPTMPSVDPNELGKNKTNNWVEYEQVTNIESGISWPAGQALPVYSKVTGTLDTSHMDNLSSDEEITFSSLQGLVNKTSVRVLLIENGDVADVTWSNTSGINFSRNTYRKSKRWDLVKKYVSEISGVVLYSTEKSSHYRNLAGTVAGTKNAIPVTLDVYNDMKNAGINLPILVDLTSLTYTSAIDIYNYMYNNYWKDCTKRLIVSANPESDFHHTRDIAASVGGAVVYLDCTKSNQRNVYEKFLKDMADADSTSIALGWYTTERSGVTTGSKYGIGTVPADHFISGTAYGGTDHTIQVPAVPTKDAVENKVYIAVYLSDGDNIQYMQRAMRKFWDESSGSRGRVAMNWTVSPSLVDIGPGILNYYYKNASSKECFVCGPSGIGYAMPYNTLWETGAAVQDFMGNGKYLQNYTKLSGTYFERAGLRVVTVWDNLTTDQRKAYEANARYLYGATVQNFRDVSSVASSTVDNMRFVKHEICYGSSYDDLYKSMENKIKNWNGNSPLFLSYQIDIWGLRPADVVRLYDALNSKYSGKFEFVRADHFFALYNEANNLDYNLCIDKSTTVTANTTTNTKRLRDGSANTLWTSKSTSNQYVQFDLGAKHTISRYVIRFAGANGMDPAYNVHAYRVQVSNDGNSWTTVDTYKENVQNVVDIEIPATQARYVKIVIDDAAGDGYARIADVEIYGK